MVATVRVLAVMAQRQRHKQELLPEVVEAAAMSELDSQPILEALAVMAK
jgi:hypothetical protein